MSTRSQLGVYEAQDTPLEDWEVLLYRHSDGYPGKEDGSEVGVLPDIIPFLKRFDKERGIGDLEYCGAWLMHHLIAEHIEWGKKWVKEHPDSTHQHKDGKNWVGYGICKSFHADIEYFYKIYPSGIDVFETRMKDSPSQWKRIRRILLK